MSLYWPFLLADYIRFVEYAAAVVAVIILISSLDDLFVDAWYWGRRIYRRFVIEPFIRPLTPAALYQRDEQPLAIMIPAWLESPVIAAMIENMVSVMDYRRYMIFVGTYPNDPDTIAEVERMRRRYKQLVRVDVRNPGPTNKADCLNHIVRAIFQHEQMTGTEFAGLVLHDAEDVLHPLELRFFNYLLPRKDLIQIPVLSLERHWSELVAGIYMDEFAEWHAKDLVVRESVAGSVPSAGVGTCFSRKAILHLMDEGEGEVFNTASLTEDYDISSRLYHARMQSIIARLPVEYRVTRESLFGFGKPKEVYLAMPLCVREFFPDTFRTSYRQKARWTLGIAFQGWRHSGWEGNWATKYFLFRDRKGIVTSIVAVLAYVVAAHFLLIYGAEKLGLLPVRFPSIFATEAWLLAVLTGNAVAFALRLVQRFYFVASVYGWEQGLMSVPRVVMANFVNFAATVRAWRLFLGHTFLGRRIVWDKTTHDFPDAGELGQQRQRLGELLLSWQAVLPEHVEEALATQDERQQPLGRILVSRGWLDEETLAEAIAFQSNLPRTHVTPHMVREFHDLLPIDLMVRRRVLPIGRDETGRLVIAVAAPLRDKALEEVRVAVGDVPLQRIARESEINDGLRLLRGVTPGMEGHQSPPLIGDLLLEKGLMQREAFDAAMENYHPDVDGRIGEYLVRCGIVKEEALLATVREQERHLAVVPA
ncbi:glycosyl transferase family protein [Xanthobacter autotrophicus DSM 431]|uniref:glycosyl transferase family protein n=1 Tax=Xanthobacter nonsaccharivorans TaxID=3119912 RepID=UPI003726E8F5